MCFHFLKNLIALFKHEKNLGIIRVHLLLVILAMFGIEYHVLRYMLTTIHKLLLS